MRREAISRIQKGKPQFKLMKKLPNYVINEYLKGKSTVEIGKELGVAPSTVANFLRRQGLTVKNPNKYKHEIDNVIVEEYNNGKSIREIARNIGVAHGTVRRHLIKLGVDLRGKPKGIYHHKHNPNLDFKKRCRKHIELYSKWSKRVLERDNYVCQICGKRGSHLEAHHIKSFNDIINEFVAKYGQDFEKFKNSEIPTDIENGITLCKECHRWIHSINPIYQQ